MQRAVIMTFFRLCDKYRIPRIPILFIHGLENSGQYIAQDNVVRFRAESFALRDSVVRTTYHEFRHYWQQIVLPSSQLQVWNTLSKAQYTWGRDNFVHPLEEDAKLFAEFPNLDKNKEILYSISPQEYLVACRLGGIGLLQLRKKISPILYRLKTSLQDRHETLQGQQRHP